MQATAHTYRYTLGESRARKHARLETKPTTGPTDTGGGYEHFRSCEVRPNTPGDAAESVYASHHRLLAIAWNIGNEETGDPLLPDGYEGVVDMSVLTGMDVHHDAPEADAGRGIEWDNREACLSWLAHERHSGLTQAEVRAYAEDGKAVRDGQATLEERETCAACDGEVKASVAGTRYCLECATEHAEGDPIEVL